MAWCSRPLRDTAFFLIPNFNYLIQASAYLSEWGIRQPLERMRACPAHPPVERFWLVAEDVTGFPDFASPFGLANGNGEGVVSIIFRRGHGQADNQGCLVVEIAWRKHQKRVDIAHFLACLGITIDPDNILSIRRPRAAFGLFAGRYHRSAPTA